MHLILLMFLLVMIALVSAGVLRRRREHRRAERAKALRYERWKARRQSIPNVSANLSVLPLPEPRQPRRSRDRLRSAPPDGDPPRPSPKGAATIDNSGERRI